MQTLRLENKVINLEHVTSIKFDVSHRKIFFNMDYAIQLKDGSFIQDFIALDLEENFKIYEKIFSKELCLNKVLMFKNFYWCDENTLLNLKSISSLKYVPELQRIIVNLNNPHTYEIKNQKKVLADFIYIEHVNQKDFEEFLVKMESL
jgi:hypothetical protein